MEDKQYYRNKAKALIKQTDLSLISSQISSVLEPFVLSQRFNSILFYYPLKTEINLLPILEKCLQQSKSCFLPVVLQTNHNPCAYGQIHSTSELNLQPGYYGNSEPLEPYFTDFTRLDLILVPGLFFDKKGNRLGRGAGFYDKLLSQLNTQVQTVGITISEAILDELPCLEDWDKQVNYIATEKELISLNLD
jgi:5-formyltetrahydrofolate cyclo-ligase